MMIMITSLMVVCALMFLKSSNPVHSVVSIVVSSFSICVLIKYTMFTSWFSFILFLIFLGGLMVVFVYMCSVASNEVMNIPLSMNELIFCILAPIIFMSMSSEMMMTGSTLKSLETMFSDFNLSMLFMAVIYLLITLFVSVQVSKMKFGPMRMKKG